jgi:hypothetical protein
MLMLLTSMRHEFMVDIPAAVQAHIIQGWFLDPAERIACIRELWQADHRMHACDIPSFNLR